MNELSQNIARRIIDIVGANGIPPEYGFQFFTTGLDPYLTIIEKEYLSSFIKDGGSAFKMVVGIYGGGKTHFLYCVRDLAWRNNFAVSYVRLSPNESPFHRLEQVYKAIVKGITPSLTAEELLSGYEQGIISFLRTWYSQKFQEFKSKGLSEDSLHEELLNYIENIEGIESISFVKAVKAAFRALMNHQEDEFDKICQWLSGEGYDRRTHERHGILQRIDRTTAFTMLRSLVQWIRQIGYSGLVVLLDEAERVPSLSTRQKEQHLSNLREVIDECGHTNFQGVMIFYAVPNENFLEGRTQIYEALRQRLSTVFDKLNPSGVKIELEKVVIEHISFLSEVGYKLAEVYKTAHNHHFDETALEKTIRIVAEAAYEQHFGDIGYKRLFVQKLIQGFHFLRQEGIPPSAENLQM
ncbi:TPA: hypothetical protein ENX78_10700 [Candidatus Poribacteria bacterium]|nr:hypothetical protein [Candidatus Poribacteria bacterium]